MPGVVRSLGNPQRDWNESVDLATAAALPAHAGTGTATLTAAANGALTVDGVAVALGERILVKDQAGGLAIDNLVYTVVQVGTPDPGGTPWILRRATDGDADAEVTFGFTVRVERGATQSGSGWSISTNDPITLGVTGVTWIPSPAGATFAAAGVLSGIEAGDAAAAGVSLTVPRGDHQHAVSTASPAATGTLAAGSGEGAATSLARSDHIHSTVPAAGGVPLGTVAARWTVWGLHTDFSGARTDGFVSRVFADSPYTVLSTDRVILYDPSGGASQVDLPAATGSGRVLVIKHNSASANAVTVEGAGAETIDGALNVALGARAAVQLLDSAAGAWSIL